MERLENQEKLALNLKEIDPLTNNIFNTDKTFLTRTIIIILYFVILMQILCWKKKLSLINLEIFWQWKDLFVLKNFFIFYYYYDSINDVLSLRTPKSVCIYYCHINLVLCVQQFMRWRNLFFTNFLNYMYGHKLKLIQIRIVNLWIVSTIIICIP